MKENEFETKSNELEITTKEVDSEVVNQTESTSKVTQTQYDCELIQDLLPLYHDDVCNVKTKQIIENHLKTCDNCRKMEEKLENTEYDERLKTESASVLNSFQKKTRRQSATIGMVTAGVLMIPVVVCLICNLAVGSKLDWFYIVLSSLLVVASLTVVPLVVQRKRFLWTLSTFTITLSILLGVTCLYTSGNWFAVAEIPTIAGLSIIFLPFAIREMPLPKAVRNKKALLTVLWDTICIYAVIFVCGFYTNVEDYWYVSLSITTFCMILPWLILLCARYMPANKYTKAGLITLISGVYAAFVNDVVDGVLGEFHKLNILRADFIHWTEDSINGNIAWILCVCCLCASIVLFAKGMHKRGIIEK